MVSYVNIYGPVALTNFAPRGTDKRQLVSGYPPFQQRDPNHAFQPQLLRRGRQAQGCRQLDEAVGKFEILKNDPNYALAHAALAVVYAAELHDEAIKHAQTVCQLGRTIRSATAMSVTYQRVGKIPGPKTQWPGRMMQQH
jgi:hypothetical protein